jgi:hypothetical protein
MFGKFLPIFGETFRQEGTCIFANEQFAITLVGETGVHAESGDVFDNRAVYVSRFDTMARPSASGPSTCRRLAEGESRARTCPILDPGLAPPGSLGVQVEYRARSHALSAVPPCGSSYSWMKSFPAALNFPLSHGSEQSGE